MRFRHWLALYLLGPNLKVEGILAMSIYAQLNDLNARLAKLEAAPPVDTSTFATADALATVASDVATLKSEVGNPGDGADATA